MHQSGGQSSPRHEPRLRALAAWAARNKARRAEADALRRQRSFEDLERKTRRAAEDAERRKQRKAENLERRNARRHEDTEVADDRRTEDLAVRKARRAESALIKQRLRVEKLERRQLRLEAKAALREQQQRERAEREEQRKLKEAEEAARRREAEEVRRAEEEARRAQKAAEEAARRAKQAAEAEARRAKKAEEEEARRAKKAAEEEARTARKALEAEQRKVRQAEQEAQRKAREAAKREEDARRKAEKAEQKARHAAAVRQQREADAAARELVKQAKAEARQVHRARKAEDAELRKLRKAEDAERKHVLTADARVRTRRKRRWALWVGLGMLAAGVSLLGWLGWQLYGTNWVSARKHDRIVEQVQEQWEVADSPTLRRSEPAVVDVAEGEVSALVRIPEFGDDYVIPVLEGTSDKVLAAGFGHFMDSDDPGEVGNYAIAAHRVTHGEPLRDMPELEVGDEVIVETDYATYTYVLTTGGDDLRVTFKDYWVVDQLPSNPDADGVEPSQLPGQRLITLTTCAELFHTDDRLVAFGVLEDTKLKS